MKNNRGVTLVEMIISITLISIVLVMMMDIFVSVRNKYKLSSIETEYIITQSEFLQVIYDDIDKYGVKFVEKEKDKIRITFNDVRTSNLSRQIKKCISIETRGGEKYINYGYDDSEDGILINKEELSTQMKRKLGPEDEVYTELSYTKHSVLNEIRIIVNSISGNDYSINVFFKEQGN